MRVPTLLLASSGLVATSHALTFTSPLPGSTIDLTSPLSISWVPSASDPSTFTLSIVNTMSGSSDGPQVLATNVRTSSTSYTLPANTISYYGDGFELQAATADGTSLAYSGAFSLADGVYTLQTASDGALTIVTSTTQGSGPSATSAPSAPITSSGGSSNSGSDSAAPSSSSPSTTGQPSPESSATPTSAIPQSSNALTSASSTTTTTSSKTGAASSTSSDSGSPFDSAAPPSAMMVTGSVLISYVVTLVGALALAW